MKQGILASFRDEFLWMPEELWKYRDILFNQEMMKNRRVMSPVFLAAMNLS